MNDLKGIIEDCNKSDLVSDKIIKKIIEIIGQEEWQDLHDENNDICTTMGELIITLNGIADLEKENAELKETVTKMNNVITETFRNLSKAKVVLRNVIDYLGQFCSDYPDCVIEAELFLKDSEVEK